MGFDQLRAEALTLPSDERATLARELIDSLGGGDESLEEALNLPQSWVNEILARSDALERGELSGDDWQTSLGRLRGELAARKQS